MITEPLLSVIVTVFNTEKYLPRCLDSVLNCSYRNIQLVVVDDASKGNIDEIMKYYLETDSRVKYVKNEINKGLFHARIAGVNNCDGEYIAFLDSDDHVSCDFYRKLMFKAAETDSDIVIGEYLLEYEDGSLKYQNLSHIRLLDIDVIGENATNLLFDQIGRDFSIHVVWNKVYKKTLWDKCYPYYVRQTKHLIMCEDVLYSSIFFYFANRITNVHDCYYYYGQNSTSSTSNGADYNKIAKSINDIQMVFSLLIDIFNNDFQRSDIVCKITEWRRLVLCYWKKSIDDCGEPSVKKKKLYDLLLDDKKIFEFKAGDFAFYNLHTDISGIQSEELKKKILCKDVKYVSFDIFDTLIVRPFLNPTDLFYLLDAKVNSLLKITDKIDFKGLRIEAEWRARNKNYLNTPSFEEITIDDIYQVIEELSGLDSLTLAKIKDLEIQLEKQYCYSRSFTKEIFEFSKYLGKSIIITSDMYLPKNVVLEILNNNGYSGFQKLYLSSDIKLTKSSGNLYRYILKDNNINASEIMHIGDNVDSDIKKANEVGIRTFYLPKTIDLLNNRVSELYCGEAFNRIFNGSFNFRRRGGLYDYFGARSLLAVVANQIFDNPFIPFNKESDFNGDPRIIGYFCLGLHLYAITDWLANEVQKKRFDTINFMARDGYLPKKAFEIIKTKRNIDVRTNYLYLTRQSILPLQIITKNDFLSLPINMSVLSQSPKSLARMFSNFLGENTMRIAKQLCTDNSIMFDKMFEGMSDFYRFIRLFSDSVFDEKGFSKYREDMYSYLKPYFKGKTANFDVGYSCRIESILKGNYSFDVSSYFIHINNDIALYRAQKNSVDVNTFYNYSPGVTGILRELLISELAPSCECITFENNKYNLIFKHYSNDYYRDTIIGEIQKYALKFVDDVSNIFKDDVMYLHYQREDISLFYEYFNTMPRIFDRELFKGLDFEDEFGVGATRSFLDVWVDQIGSVSPVSCCEEGTTLDWFYPLWQRAICLFFIDRGLLKRKIKNKLANKPVQLKALQKIYSSIRYIYRKFK